MSDKLEVPVNMVTITASLDERGKVYTTTIMVQTNNQDEIDRTGDIAWGQTLAARTAFEMGPMTPEEEEGKSVEGDDETGTG